jgi:CRP/FNR family transcriptional regulator, dissimilatory nitrate respiration regulator
MRSAREKKVDDTTIKQQSYSMDCLKGASLFSNLSEKEMVSFCDVANAKVHKKGKVLYLEGESASFFYVICSGWIKLFHTLPEGDEIIVDMLTAGQMVGENAIFEHGNYTSSAEIIEDVHLISIPTTVLNEQIRLSPALAIGMLSSMFQHHRRHYGESALNAMQNAPQRIGSFLLRLCPRGKTTGIVFYLPYDKTLIADTLGMKRSTFSRALNILRQKTAIRITGARVEIDLVDPLVKFVYGSLSTSYVHEKV